jgi:signal transduction histidine kinase
VLSRLHGAYNQSDIAAKQLVVSMSLWAERHYVLADAARIQQILWNLLKNAVKFTPRSGRIDVRSVNDGGHLVVEVTDSGIGIDADALPKLFNAFQQADRTITRRFGGLGLGLTISRALAEMHGGTLSAASGGAGKGATFSLRLPTSAAPVRPGPAHKPPAGRGGDDAERLHRLLHDAAVRPGGHRRPDRLLVLPGPRVRVGVRPGRRGL